MNRLNIAGVNFNLITPSNGENDIGVFELFRVKSFNEPSISLRFIVSSGICTSGEKIYSEEGLSWWKVGKATEIAITKRGEDYPFALLHANENWTDIKIITRKKVDDLSYGVFRTLSEIAFRTVMLYHSGIVIHAAAIMWNNRGIIFSAPANTGKSTQADLWVKHMGATILNGDRPALRIVNDDTFIYGTPWSGSLQDFVNKSAPLSAIILLEQHELNSIKRLTVHEALDKFTPRCFLPYWDRSLMEKSLTNIEKILVNTPIWLLKCRPDREAVEVVRNCVESIM